MIGTDPPAPLEPGGTLVIQTAFLGDVVLTTPLLAALAKQHGPVDVLVRPAAAPLLETLPSVRDVLSYDKRGRDQGFSGLKKMVRRLAQRRYARAYLPHQSFRSAVIARWARIPERIGFGSSGSAWLYTKQVPRPTSGHESERLRSLAGPTRDSVSVQVGVTPDDRDQAYAWLAARGIGDGFVAFAPGSVWGTKRWPGYPELAKMLKGRIVVMGGPEDTALAQTVVDAAPDRVASAAGAFPLRVSAAVIERAAVLVTNDSAPLHLASAVGTPTVAIFGPTAPSLGFGPLSPQAAIVERSDLPCRPCSTHGPQTCPLGHHRCMREIPAQVVRDAILRLTH